MSCITEQCLRRVNVWYVCWACVERFPISTKNGMTGELIFSDRGRVEWNLWITCATSWGKRVLNAWYAAVMAKESPLCVQVLVSPHSSTWTQIRTVRPSCYSECCAAGRLLPLHLRLLAIAPASTTTPRHKPWRGWVLTARLCSAGSWDAEISKPLIALAGTDECPTRQNSCTSWIHCPGAGHLWNPRVWGWVAPGSWPSFEAEALVAQCSATPATVAATPPCSATPFQTQISVRHLQGKGGGGRCDTKIFRGCSATPVLHLQNALKSRKSAATRVARQGVPAIVCNYGWDSLILPLPDPFCLPEPPRRWGLTLVLRFLLFVSETKNLPVPVLESKNGAKI